MSPLVELRRDSAQQLWAFYDDGTVWPHGIPRFDDDGWAWAGMQRRWLQWMTQRERLVWAREALG